MAEPFFWGAGGKRVSSPEAAAKQRAIAEALIGRSETPAQNWAQGLADVAAAWSGTQLRNQADEAEQEGQRAVAELLAGLTPESGFSDISAVMANPWSTASQSAVAQALMGNQFNRSNIADERAYQAGLLADQRAYDQPMRDLQLEGAGISNQAAQAQLDALLNPPPPAPIKVGDVLVDPVTFEPLFDARGEAGFTLSPGQQRFDASGQPIAGVEAAPDDLTSAIQNYNHLISRGVPEDQATQLAFGGQTTNVNVNTGSTNDFFTGLSEAETDNFASMLQAGTQASRNLAQLGQLEELLASAPQGLEGAATQFAANFGIDLGGAQGVQAAQALINQMVPAQRPPGSGPMSDADLELYKQSIPRIMNQPGGNELIIGTMRAINEYDRQLAAIVQDGVARAELTDDPAERAQIRREMRAAIDGLQNPIDAFKAQAGQITGASATSSAVPANQSQANPAIFGGAGQPQIGQRPVEISPGITIRRLD